MTRKPNPFRYNITAWDSNGNRQLMHAATMKGILSQYNAWLVSANGKLLRPTYHTIHVSNEHGEKLLDLSNVVEI